MVCPEGFKPPTYRTATCCSIQLSYGHTLKQKRNYNEVLQNYWRKSKKLTKIAFTLHKRSENLNKDWW